MESILEEMRTHGTKMDTNKKTNQETNAGQEQMKETIERYTFSPVSRMEADRLNTRINQIRTSRYETHSLCLDIGHE
jgi:hypothetical protein